MMKTQRLLFGGSFDPPHRGHFEILRYISQKKFTDCMEIIPAAVSPLKQEKPPHAAAENRLAMLERLLSSLGAEDLGKTKFGKTKIHLLDIELRRKPPSYTADTCLALRKKYPNESIAVLIGSDSLMDLESWGRIEEIFSYHPFWIFLRKNRKEAEEKCRRLRHFFPKARLTILSDSPVIPCSSSRLRQLLSENPEKSWSKKKDFSFCLLPEIQQYIKEKGLYQNPI